MGPRCPCVPAYLEGLMKQWERQVPALCLYVCMLSRFWVRSLGWEDPLEKGKATHSNILVWRIP